MVLNALYTPAVLHYGSFVCMLWVLNYILGAFYTASIQTFLLRWKKKKNCSVTWSDVLFTPIFMLSCFLLQHYTAFERRVKEKKKDIKVFSLSSVSVSYCVVFFLLMCKHCLRGLVLVCVCVCVWERERERGGGTYKCPEGWTPAGVTGSHTCLHTLICTHTYGNTILFVKTSLWCDQ